MPSSVSSGLEPTSGTLNGRDGPRLEAHLAAYLGRWPPRRPVDVVGHPGLLEPAWDGALLLAAALASPLGTVVSVPPGREADAAALAGHDDVLGDGFRDALATALSVDAGKLSPWVPFRWSTDPAPLPDAGVWVDHDHPGLPDWLQPFPGPLLVTFDPTSGRYLAGVGFKPHTPWGWEIAVGTEEEARGQGLGRRLVAQAARAALARGVVPLYLHHPDNLPSAKVADAAGFPDRGWRFLVAWD